MPQPRRRARTDDARVLAGFDAARREHDVVVEHPPAVLAEAAEAARRGPGAFPGRGGRTDLRDLPFVTLDPPGSMDLDQAMHLERRGTGYRVRYAIADVAAFVRPGGAVDREAHRRVQTVYCPDRRAPLHPAPLSEGAASLLPDEVRPAVVWTVDLDEDGRDTRVDVVRATVRSVARLDYASEQARLDAGVERDDPMALLAEIGALRSALERERGGLHLGRPDQEVVARADGSWDLEFRSPLALEDHNAQVSLLTGMAAARLMLDAGVGVLRTMPTASDEAVARLRRQARALGVDWGDDESYGDVLARVDHRRPEVAAFLAAATSLFRGAAWTPFRGAPPEPATHGAVAAPYAHVTAPLRRLVDRYGLEICLAVSTGTDVPEWVLAELDGLRATTADGARRASAVDRACTDVVEAFVLEPHVGRALRGVALDDDTVQLAGPAVVARTRGADLVPGTTVEVLVEDVDVPDGVVGLRLSDTGDGPVAGA